METKTSNRTKSSSRDTMEKNSLLEKFFIEELRDIYDAEKQIVKALPKMKKAASSPQLAQAFEQHIAETNIQINRLKEVFELFGEKATAKTCDAMEGLIDEGEQVIQDTDDNTSTRDVGLIFAAQKIEHYEIASYGGLAQLARTMDRNDVAEILATTLNEEIETDRLLTEIAENSVNYQASEE